jgi:hypothetical protein
VRSDPKDVVSRPHLFCKRSFIGVLAFACLSGEYVST